MFKSLNINLENLLFVLSEKARLLAKAKVVEDGQRQTEVEVVVEAKRMRVLEREAAREAIPKV